MECWARNEAEARHDKRLSDEYGWAFSELSDLAREDPEKCWLCILHAVGDVRCQPHLGVLAAGPLEDLLGYHGSAFIDRVEIEARGNQVFAHTLGGVWEAQIAEDIWTRVQQVWDTSHWADRNTDG